MNKEKKIIEEETMIKKIKCLIDLIYSYEDTSKSIIVYSDLSPESDISVNEIINELNKEIDLSKFIILYKEEDKSEEDDENLFINCGTYPLSKNYFINIEDNVEEIKLSIKLRTIIDTNEKLNMDLEEDENDAFGESKTKLIGIKNKRSKERKIGDVVSKVYLWKQLYYGFEERDESGNKIIKKYSLEEAAQIVGISKKSLDDYLIQLKVGKTCGFDFTAHKNDKIGLLRAFVKKHKQQYNRIKKAQEK